MSLDETREYAPPDFQTPKTFGILNLVFALSLMSCGLCYGFYAMVPPLLSYLGQTLEAKDAERAARKQAEIASLAEQEKAAATEAEKAELKKHRAEVEARPDRDPGAPVFLNDDRLRDPRYLGHFLMDLGTGLILNLAMLASGVGLVYLKGWGRKLAVAVAWLKIARLLALALSFSIVVAPFLASAITAMDAEAAAADPAHGPATPELGPMVAVGFAGLFWAVFAFGSIYPALTIWLLGRASVREACRPRD